MPRYIITAQSYSSSQRITRTLEARDKADAYLIVAAELDGAGFYILSITTPG